MPYKKTRKLKKLFNERERKNKHKKYTKRGGTPKLQRLNASKKNVDSILERIKINQDASRANMQKMFRYIQGKSSPQYDLGQAEHPDPVYDIGQAKSGSPVYDLGRAKSGSPVYDLGQAKGSPIYDMGQAKGSPIYDMGQAHPTPEVFAKIIKNLEDKSKEYNRDELIKLTTENVHQYVGYNILFGTRNKYIVKKILGVSKTGKSIQIDHPDLQNSLEIVSRQVYVILKKSPVYDLGQAEPIYDLGQAKSSSPIYDIGQAEAEQTSMSKLNITDGSWDFYTLKIVDSQPKTEKELCELMKVKFPERITGKTPCNTLNRVLQTLVKHGYINRIAFKKKDTQKKDYYKYFTNDVSV